MLKPGPIRKRGGSTKKHELDQDQLLPRQYGKILRELKRIEKHFKGSRANKPKSEGNSRKLLVKLLHARSVSAFQNRRINAAACAASIPIVTATLLAGEIFQRNEKSPHGLFARRVNIRSPQR